MDSSSSTHRSTTTTTTSSSSSNGSEFFICFNARRRLKTEFSARPSILSPARDPQISLSTCRSISSRSRRLRSSGSTTRNRGRSSPMFAGAVKKRGSLGFDNPEPSSPKVTCIGQVRVKTKKKKGIKLRRRHNGEVSFRSLDHMQRQSSYNNNNAQFHHHPRNQRWVHLPSSICESFNCLVPCRPPCDRANEKVVKKQESEKLVEQVEEKEEMEMLAFRSTRRHVFDKIEIKEEVFDGNEELNVNVPPKNALLLMRFRSDPAKLEAIVSRCLETHHAPKQVEDDEDVEENEDLNVEKVEVKDVVEMVEIEEVKVCEQESGLHSVNILIEEKNEEAMRGSLQGNEGEKTIGQDIESNGVVQYLKQEYEKEEKQDSVRLVSEDEEENDMNLVELFRVVVDEESEEDDDEVDSIEEKNEEDGSRVSYSNASFSLQSDDDDDDISEPGEQQDNVEQKQMFELNVECKRNHKEEAENDIQDMINDNKPVQELSIVEKECCHELEMKLKKECEMETSSRLVADNLVLTMSDPKLSIDVCKETWMPNTINARVDDVECCDSVVVQQQKQRGSSAVSMSAMIEQKLQEAAVYEPFVLSRCKSAPIRYRRPDGWFWKNEGLELHSKVGAHGFVGFQLSR